MKQVFLAVILGLSIFSCTHTEGEEAPERANQGEMDMGSMGHMRGMGMMMSPEAHQKMSEMHQEVADCLEQGESEMECREIIRSYRQRMCEDLGDGSGCRILGRMLQGDNAGDLMQDRLNGGTIE